MLTEQRHALILKMLEEKKSITVTEVKDMLGISESTVRRDIIALDKAGRLTKVFGGAVAVNYATFVSKEASMVEKQEINREEKERIARYAASLIGNGEFIYLDAGTTTGFIVDYMDDPTVTVVTNAPEHAGKLARKGIKVFVVGGEMKATTDAIIGSSAVKDLMNYHFTKGFFGTNGITKSAGFTTPDVNEAAVKSMAMEQCKKCYMTADASKFDLISSVSFSTFYGAEILTDRLVEGYEDVKNITVV